jgi:hypothetical protein
MNFETPAYALGRVLFSFNSPTSSKKGDAHGIGLTGDMGEGLVKYLFFGDIRCAYVGQLRICVRYDT